MNNLTKVLFCLGVTLGAGGFAPVSNHLCTGFVPENDLQIPISVNQVGGLTEAQFNTVLDTVQSVYGPIIATKGGNLSISRQWSNNTVNASAQQSGSTWIINMFGGLARHPDITIEGFALVACHELGHHIGGAPKIAGWFNVWATNEGGSDYFATLKCLRRIFNDQENEEFVKNTTIDPVLKEKCEMIYSNIPERNLCMRSGMGGMSVSLLFKALKSDTVTPAFNTPDPSVVTKTNDRHPDPQCRLDTYFQGTICPRSIDDDVSNDDANAGVCSLPNGNVEGVRPLCWYKP